MDTIENIAGDNEFVMIEGTINHFQWCEGNENLLEQIQQRSRLKNAAAGTAAAALDLYGTFATSAMVAMYDGEYTENFACVVDGKIVCGTFCGARKLTNGDQVKIMATPLEEGIFHVTAIQRPKDELIWLPQGVFWGDKAAHRDSIRSVLQGGIFAMILSVLVAIGGLLFTPLDWTGAAIFIGVSLVAIPLIGFFGEFFPERVGKSLGELGSKIFKTYGFPDYDDLDMTRAGYERQTRERHTSDIYMYSLAINAHLTGTKLTTKLERDIETMQQKRQAGQSGTPKAKTKSRKR